MFAPKVKRERAHAAFAKFFDGVGVHKMYDSAITNRAAQQFKALAQLFGDMKLRHEGTALFEPLPPLARKRRGDFCNCGERSRAKLRRAPRFDHACAERERFNFFEFKHEWRQLEPTAQPIAHTGFAFNRCPGQREISNVAIDCALADFEPFRQLARSRQAPPAQILHDAEQAISAAHGVSLCFLQASTNDCCGSSRNGVASGTPPSIRSAINSKSARVISMCPKRNA